VKLPAEPATGATGRRSRRGRPCSIECSTTCSPATGRVARPSPGRGLQRGLSSRGRGRERVSDPTVRLQRAGRGRTAPAGANGSRHGGLERSGLRVTARRILRRPEPPGRRGPLHRIAVRRRSAPRRGYAGSLAHRQRTAPVSVTADGAAQTLREHLGLAAQSPVEAQRCSAAVLIDSQTATPARCSRSGAEATVRPSGPREGRGSPHL
jgi:hypothetical protein